MGGMDVTDSPVPDPALDRLVHALVMWGATASQIVSHMEHWQRSGASRSSASTVEVFSSLVGELARPVVSGRSIALEQVAEVVEAIDDKVSAELLLVALPAPNRATRRRRSPH
jgi:hypothetical protein